MTDQKNFIKPAIIVLLSLAVVFVIPNWLLTTLLVLASVFLILLILIQRGKGGGLAGAFGGAGGSSAFGSKAADVFTTVTICTALVWFALNMQLVYRMNQRKESAFSDEPGRTKASGTRVPGKPQRDDSGKETTTPPEDKEPAAPEGKGSPAPDAKELPAPSPSPKESPAPRDKAAPAATPPAPAPDALPSNPFEDTPAPKPADAKAP